MRHTRSLKRWYDGWWNEVPPDIVPANNVSRRNEAPVNSTGAFLLGAAAKIFCLAVIIASFGFLEELSVDGGYGSESERVLRVGLIYPLFLLSSVIGVYSGRSASWLKKWIYRPHLGNRSADGVKRCRERWLLRLIKGLR